MYAFRPAALISQYIPHNPTKLTPPDHMPAKDININSTGSVDISHSPTAVHELSPHESLTPGHSSYAYENSGTPTPVPSSLHPPSPSGGEVISDSSAEDKYRGLSALEFIMLDVDLSWSFHRLLLELNEFESLFDPSINAAGLCQGLKGVYKSLATLEKLADWIDANDMMQWHMAIEQHQIWASYQRKTCQGSMCNCMCHQE
ncbi:hypothetical protein EDD18DRAFT_1365502 [Armillaria luteobubalina]|uniref:Uncharacterized protein n=1 Tax=Armillaria luteobubalina TaxID=153913 RepID=A0AA39TB33_9AGAR|nr:hypothetical protein EDD18DRAFT_1365502 [Armillaria luteobubalina]